METLSSFHVNGLELLRTDASEITMTARSIEEGIDIVGQREREVLVDRGAGPRWNAMSLRRRTRIRICKLSVCGPTYVRRAPCGFHSVWILKTSRLKSLSRVAGWGNSISI